VVEAEIVQMPYTIGETDKMIVYTNTVCTVYIQQ